MRGLAGVERVESREESASDGRSSLPTRPWPSTTELAKGARGRSGSLPWPAGGPRRRSLAVLKRRQQLQQRLAGSGTARLFRPESRPRRRATARERDTARGRTHRREQERERRERASGQTAGHRSCPRSGRAGGGGVGRWGNGRAAQPASPRRPLLAPAGVCSRPPQHIALGAASTAGTPTVTARPLARSRPRNCLAAGRLRLARAHFGGGSETSRKRWGSVGGSGAGVGASDITAGGRSRVE